VMFGRWLASCAKPSTLAHYQYMLAKSGVPKTHCEGVLAGHVTAARSVTGPPRESPRARPRTCWRRSAQGYADRGRQTPGRR